MRTFIKWFGNKSRYKQKLICHFPKNIDTYIEPFIGSGAVFLEIQRQKWIINDINNDLIHVWVSIKNYLYIIIKIVSSFSKTFLSLDKPDQLALCRSITNKLQNMRYGPSRATYYLLMKYCVYLGSLIKNNKFYFRGLELNFMNTKYTPTFSKPIYIEKLKKLSKFLNTSNGQILNQDYVDVLKIAKNGDFVFMDPPYIEDHKYDFEYNMNAPISSSFIVELFKECKKLDKRNIQWLMTQADTPIVRNLFKNYVIIEMKVYRQSRKVYTTELIIKNYK